MSISSIDRNTSVFPGTTCVNPILAGNMRNMRHYAAYGAWLKGERDRRGITQRELAASSGVFREYISRIERGTVQLPGPDIRRRLGMAFGYADEGPWRPGEPEPGEDAESIGKRVAWLIRGWTPEQRQAMLRLIENAAELIELERGGTAAREET